jgi:RNA polymerase sigma factor (sigma-70 family)
VRLGPDERVDALAPGPRDAPIGPEPASAVHRTIEAIHRLESPRLIAAIARIVRDVGVAEELVQDALVAALAQWPASGVPANPGAWLMGTAKHHALNTLRRAQMIDRRHAELGRAEEDATRVAPEVEAMLDDDVGDDLLRLVFTACHPVLAIEARVALTLRLVAGLTTPEIARAFLVSETTMAQRIVRAKRTLRAAGVGFEAPRAHEWPERLSSVLAIVYLVFNEGYAATAGDAWVRPELCEDALRLGRILAALVPAEAEVHGLVALMELQASRMATRVDAAGDPVLLADQARTRWDWLLIQRGLAALARAEELGGARGPYALQAAIAACHARARTFAETDWRQMAALYAELARVAPSPVVQLNRAVAVSMAEGAEAGLALLDRLVGDPALRQYHRLPSVRGDLLEKLGRLDEARAEFARAASLARNARERALLLARASACRSPTT